VSTATAGATVAAALAAAAARLERAAIAEPRREARLILALALDRDPGWVLGHPEHTLGGASLARFEGLIGRRARHEPFSRLKGSREFWSLDFALSAATLDPRPDSETLIEAALALLPDRRAALSVVDLGTGSGCLLLALLSELPNATGLGIDILPGAVNTAQRNAETLGLAARSRFAVADWRHGLIAEEVDVILANPPYIPFDEVPHLSPEIRDFDPGVALDGGKDGLDAYRALGPAITAGLLARHGFAAFEVGTGQAVRAAGILEESGLKIKEIRRDLAGIERCIIAAH